MYIANILKKLAAILLIALFAFNLFGYRVLFYFAGKQSDSNSEKAFDRNQYNEEDLIAIKIPMSIPYQIQQKDFERFDGEVSLNGRIYKYVKRKVCDGNLILLCLPDQNKMHLEAASNDFFKYANDLQNTSSKKSGNSKSTAGKNISNEYNQNIDVYNMVFWNRVNTYGYLKDIFLLPSSLRSSPEQPPELV